MFRKRCRRMMFMTIVMGSIWIIYLIQDKLFTEYTTLLDRKRSELNRVLTEVSRTVPSVNLPIISEPHIVPTANLPITSEPHTVPATNLPIISEPRTTPNAQVPIISEPHNVPNANLPSISEPRVVPAANLPIISESHTVPTANLPIVAEYIANLPIHSDADSLYPSSEHPWDNRIFKQLTYVPKHINGIKKIYTHFAQFSRRVKQNSIQQFKDWRCHVHQCTIITQRTAHESDIIDADILLLDNTLPKPEKVLKVFREKRRPEQIWALVTGEAPPSTKDPFRGDSYNWTVSHAPSSPLTVLYGSAFQLKANVSTLPQTRDWSANRTGLIIWIVSNCRAYNYRERYHRKLAKFIHVDVFGKCGEKMINCNNEQFHNQCARKMIPNYKFYLAFENHNCDTWVTEKPFINALRNDVIPIVMGPPRDYARHIFPTNSYIHVDDFKSAKHLAEYLHKVASNDMLYNSYFQWKGAWAIREHDDEIWLKLDDIPPYNVFCRVCALLHAPPRPMVTTLQEYARTETCDSRRFNKP